MEQKFTEFSMKWGYFKNSICHLFLPSAEVERQFLTQEIDLAGLITTLPFQNYTVFVTEFAEFSENI